MSIPSPKNNRRPAATHQWFLPKNLPSPKQEKVSSSNSRGLSGVFAVTLPETNSLLLKMDGWNTISFWDSAYFQGLLTLLVSGGGFLGSTKTELQTMESWDTYPSTLPKVEIQVHFQYHHPRNTSSWCLLFCGTKKKHGECWVEFFLYFSSFIFSSAVSRSCIPVAWQGCFSVFFEHFVCIFWFRGRLRHVLSFSGEKRTRRWWNGRTCELVLPLTLEPFEIYDIILNIDLFLDGKKLGEKKPWDCGTVCFFVNKWEGAAFLWKQKATKGVEKIDHTNPSTFGHDQITIIASCYP